MCMPFDLSHTNRMDPPPDALAQPLTLGIYADNNVLFVDFNTGTMSQMARQMHLDVAQFNSVDFHRDPFTQAFTSGSRRVACEPISAHSILCQVLRAWVLLRSVLGQPESVGQRNWHNVL